ncbi:helix-turn-helix domain-containing protein [Intrasporangium sp. YIM S08009]|uniref:TetR/AcrR family transcriptional regulator n=1 Tax=Intrasporangium zincisolvens TaxID=3080018 RepID=UPI002B05E4DC|nr:helix-turn-helix domain-containing protein [Intrasporangium sp. YIM S08009]
MSRPPRDALRREIVDVAQRMFAGIGFRGTSLQMIADAAGCSKAALLYHFKTKTAILEELLDPLVVDVERIRAGAPELPPTDAVAFALEHAAALVVKHRSAIAMLRGLEDMADEITVVGRGQEWVDELTEVVVADEDTLDRRVAAHAFVAGLLAACLSLPDVDDEDLSGALLRLGARMFDRDPASLTTVRL